MVKLAKWKWLSWYCHKRSFNLSPLNQPKLATLSKYFTLTPHDLVINCAFHLCDPGSTLASGRMWAEFQSISIWLRGFFFGYSGFPPSSKLTPSQLHLAGFAVLQDHTWIVWQEPWAPSHAFGSIPLSRLILKSPCREWSTQHTFTFTFAFYSSMGSPQESKLMG